MISSTLVAIVEYCIANRWRVVTIGAVLAAFAVAFDLSRFSITTDTETLISSDLPWRQRQAEFSKEFPEKKILVVLDGPTTETVEQAASELAGALAKQPTLFRSISQPGGGEFFRRNGLLFQSATDVTQATDGLSKGSILVEALTSDPSLRGILGALSFVVEGVKEGKLTLDQLGAPLSLAARSMEDVLAGRPAYFSWQALLQGQTPQSSKLRRFIEIEPVLDFSALQPGRAATDAIHRIASELHLGENFGTSLQLTGTVPLNDDQYSVLGASALRDTVTALLGTLLILWIAMRSWKIVAAVFFSVLVGLTATTALGLALVGSFNLLSIAFFVLFVGLGVDFGIQFSVRYRSERHACGELNKSLVLAARGVATPLSLAAAATAAAFFSFVPTSYTGLSELGLIAGFGMLVAFMCSITLVPAALAILIPPTENTDVGFVWLAPLDDFLQRHRTMVIFGTFGAVVLAAPLLLRLSFDLDPIDLQDQQAASVVAYRQLQSNPLTSGNEADIVVKSLAVAETVSKSIAALPEVSAVRTLNSFVPEDQPQKLAAIAIAAKSLAAAFTTKTLSSPSDGDTIVAIQSTSGILAKVAQNFNGPGADTAKHFVKLLNELAQASPQLRERAGAVFVPPLVYDLAWLKDALGAQPLTASDLPPAIIGDWLLPDGRARIQVEPRGNFSDSGVLTRFATSVLSAFPTATGPAISLYESGRTVIDAFVQAGLFALTAITLLLLIVLKRVMDVLLTVIPLLLAGVVTLEVCGGASMPINFANIIALPLLLGVGVAFKIYYVLAWRGGQYHLLETGLTRAVIFSAMTNAVAFGSMWSSNYPGMSSMGKLMALSLLCTMTAAVLFQPVLMGPPRKSGIGTTAPTSLTRDAAE